MLSKPMCEWCVTWHFSTKCYLTDLYMLDWLAKPSSAAIRRLLQSSSFFKEKTGNDVWCELCAAKRTKSTGVTLSLDAEVVQFSHSEVNCHNVIIKGCLRIGSRMRREYWRFEFSKFFWMTPRILKCMKHWLNNKMHATIWKAEYGIMKALYNLWKNGKRL